MKINLEKIKELAKAKDLKIKDVYQGIGIAQTTLDQQIRKKNIDLQSYIRICSYFNVALDFFIEKENASDYSVSTLSEYSSNYSKIQLKCEKCEEKERTIKVQEDMISTQKAMLNLLQNENTELKKKTEALTIEMQKIQLMTIREVLSIKPIDIIMLLKILKN